MIISKNWLEDHIDINLDDSINLVITPQNRLDLSKSLNFNIVAENDLQAGDINLDNLLSSTFIQLPFSFTK